MKIGNYAVNFKLFENHSKDRIMFWSDFYNQSATLYFFKNDFNHTISFYQNRPLFLLNIQTFFTGV